MLRSELERIGYLGDVPASCNVVNVRLMTAFHFLDNPDPPSLWNRPQSHNEFKSTYCHTYYVVVPPYSEAQCANVVAVPTVPYFLPRIEGRATENITVHDGP